MKSTNQQVTGADPGFTKWGPNQQWRRQVLSFLWGVAPLLPFLFLPPLPSLPPHSMTCLVPPIPLSLFPIPCSIPSLSLPSLLPFSSPPSHPFPSLFPSLPVPPSCREAAPLIPARGSGEHCKFPPAGSGSEPSGNRIWCILALKRDIWWQKF